MVNFDDWYVCSLFHIYCHSDKCRIDLHYYIPLDDGFGIYNLPSRHQTIIGYGGNIDQYHLATSGLTFVLQAQL